MIYGATVWPDDEYALPVYSSFWAESEKGSYFIIDFYPTADCICDIPYMEKYLEPLEDLYDKGKEHFPGLSTRDPQLVPRHGIPVLYQCGLSSKHQRKTGLSA